MRACRTCGRPTIGRAGSEAECFDCWADRASRTGAAHGCHDDPDDAPPPPDWWDYAAYAGIAVFLAVAAVGLGMCWEALT